MVDIRHNIHPKRLLAKNHGFSSKDLYFLHVLGGARTHIIWSGIRYFSCFSDAANYGVHAAMSAVTFAIAAFLLIRDGSVSTSFLSLFAVFTEWGFPEPGLPWVFLWVVC